MVATPDVTTLKEPANMAQDAQLNVRIKTSVKELLERLRQKYEAEAPHDVTLAQAVAIAIIQAASQHDLSINPRAEKKSGK